MSNLKKFFSVFLAAVIIFITSNSAFAQNGEDWEKGVIRVVGLGAGPENVGNFGNFYQKYAQQMAQLDALRNLLEAVGGIESFDNERVDEIKVKLENTAVSEIVAKGAYIVESKFNTDGTCEVTMEMPLFGENSVAEWRFLNFKNGKKISFPNPTNIAEIGNEKYTGLIVDCQNLNFVRDITPEIQNEDKESVYCAENLNYDKVFNLVVNSGMVEYTKNINRQTRAGQNPLTVKAIKVGHGTIIVSNSDADKILTANRKFHFLEKCAVVVVY